MTLDEHLFAGVEHHPLEPFLPENAVLLMLGSFPPQKKRWSMDFFYPNLQNDMWRIFGFIFFDDKDYFLSPEKIFDKERIIAFLREKGIALYDTASCVRRLQDNASDKFLEVVSPTDIGLLLQQLPSCRAVVTTGQKATDVFCEQMEAKEPPVGGGSMFHFRDRELTLYRMPSSSRAYPLKLEKKRRIIVICSMTYLYCRGILEKYFSKSLAVSEIYTTFATANTGIAQLVEHRSPKPSVGSSSLSSRAEIKSCNYLVTAFFYL